MTEFVQTLTQASMFIVLWGALNIVPCYVYLGCSSKYLLSVKNVCLVSGGGLLGVIVSLVTPRLLFGDISAPGPSEHAFLALVLTPVIMILSNVLLLRRFGNKVASPNGATQKKDH
jgi:hypothetical protein